MQCQSYLWNSHSLLSSGHTCRVLSQREMQWKWKAWLHTPQATVHSSLVAEAWLAWHSMPVYRTPCEMYSGDTLTVGALGKNVCVVNRMFTITVSMDNTVYKCILVLQLCATQSIRPHNYCYSHILYITRKTVL